jgi:ABC-type Fe3+-hydroxamate transport system substrate-binding protein
MFFTDHLSRRIFLPKPPERIISLVPSQTELLVDLGLEERIVGVTKFCVHPTHLRKNKTIVGGTKNYRFDVIKGLKPDLIIGNKEENDCAGIDTLSSSYPVWMSDVSDLKESLQMISDLGQITHSQSRADEIIREIETGLAESTLYKGTCVYLIWNKPSMAAGKNTFIDAMLTLAGFENVVQGERYPEITEEELIHLAPEYVLLSSEPFPFSETHRQEIRRLCPTARVLLVDGEMFSWYGSRLLYAKDYFRGLSGV